MATISSTYEQGAGQYGQTEIAPLATLLGPEDQLRKPDSCGKAERNVKTRVVNDMMQDVAVDEAGDLCIARPI